MPFALGFDPDALVTVAVVDETRWKLTEPLTYSGQVDTFEVPAGYITDFATVPRVAVWLVPRFGRYTRAAILHDWLLTDAVPLGRVSPVDADGLFRRAMAESGVPPVKRWLMWAGVRWAALGRSYRRPGWYRTGPAVVAISLLALPLAVPMLGVAAGLVMYGAAEFVATGGRRSGTLST